MSTAPLIEPIGCTCEDWPVQIEKVVIDVIPHSAQRYPTVGDWVQREGALHVRVSDTGNPLYNQLIALHEYVEALLCLNAGITPAQVDAFDISWRPHDGIEEPGDDPAAPYWRQHQLATGLERFMAAQLNVSWENYEKAVDALHAPGA